jgi:hypothetical protein
MGQVGEQAFVIHGQTMYIPENRTSLPFLWIAAGAALGCMGILGITILIFAVAKRNKPSYKSKT